MSEVVLHVYDVTNSASAKTNNVIVQLNKIMKDGIGIGGIFHSAVQVYGEEWSFGYCENGTGVFNCPPKQNPMYTYRESIVLGKTNLPTCAVTKILTELGRKWQGHDYDLLSKNCNHFCDKFCEALDVQRLPAWVNRFAHAGDTALEVAESTAVRFRQAKTDIVSASKVAYRFLLGGTSTPGAEDQGSVHSVRSANGSNGMFQSSWLKNIPILKSSVTSQDVPNGDKIQDQRSKDNAGLRRKDSALADSV